MPAFPQLIAHRGASHDAPENTLAAFALAWQQGADGIEGDFRLTKDGEIVCLHDATTGRVGDQPATVAGCTAAELRRLDVGRWRGPQWAGQQIPTLGEVLAIVPPGRKIFIELKCGPEVVVPLEQALRSAGLSPEQTVVISFDAEVIAETKRRRPGLKALLLTGFDADPATSQWKPAAPELLAILRRTGADGVDIQARAAIDQSYVDWFRASGKEFHVWVVDHPFEAQHCVRLGVDSITTNRPAWLRHALLPLVT